MPPETQYEPYPRGARPFDRLCIECHQPMIGIIIGPEKPPRDTCESCLKERRAAAWNGD